MATTTNYGWTTPNDTDLVKDGAAAIRTLGSSIDTTVFNNASAAIAKTIVDAKGDIIAATAADTVARLGVGANDTVLTADSSTATGLKWSAPSSGALTKITSASFTTQSSVIIDNCFTSTYINYMVVWNTIASVEGADLQIQFRYAGPTTEATNYNGAGAVLGRNNSTATYGFASASQGTIADYLGDSNDRMNLGTMYISNVGTASEFAKYHGTGTEFYFNGVLQYSGSVDVARTYTGFLLKPSSGTITGSYTIYGLAD
jgi:hypothetical protein